MITAIEANVNKGMITANKPNTNKGMITAYEANAFIFNTLNCKIYKKFNVCVCHYVTW